jgi:hypothetical protein
MLLTRMNLLLQALWWGSLPVLGIVLGCMIVRGSHKNFPRFFVYIVYAVATGVLRFVVSGHLPLYAYVYWATDAGYAVLGIAVMYEALTSTFQNLGHRSRLRLLFAAIVLLTLSLTAILTATTRNDLTRTMALIVGAEMGTRLVEVAMFVLLLVATPVLGLRWRQHAFGICAGFGIYSTCALLASTKYYEIGSRFNFLWSVISVVSYTVAVLIWLWYFSTPIPADATNSEQPPLSLSALERYKEIARRVPRP